jgi:type I restriction enzyme S subunit
MSEIPPLHIQPKHWKIVNDILQRWVPEYEVWAFGSRVNGNVKPYSDLDLVIIGNQPLSLHISAQLDEAFSQSDLPWRVDVVNWATTSEAFRNVIARHKVVLQPHDN